MMRLSSARAHREATLDGFEDVSFRQHSGLRHLVAKGQVYGDGAGESAACSVRVAVVDALTRQQRDFRAVEENVHRTIEMSAGDEGGFGAGANQFRGSTCPPFPLC